MRTGDGATEIMEKRMVANTADELLDIVLHTSFDPRIVSYHYHRYAVLDLSGYLIDRLERQGIEIVTPKSESEHAGIVSFQFPDAENTFETLKARLALPRAAVVRG